MAKTIQTKDAESTESRSESQRPQHSVKVIAKQGSAVLVEWIENGAPWRRTVPANVIKDGKASVSDLNAGVPYGDNFSFLTDNVTEGLDLADELHRQGVWLVTDILPNIDAVKAAVIRVVAQPVIARLIERAKEEK